MSAHARFPVDPAARIAPDKLDEMADAADDPEWRRALRQAARDARTLERLRAWLDEQETNCDGMAESFWSYRTVLNKLDTLERDA